MDSTRISSLHSLSLTGALFGMLYDCPLACGKSCPLYTVRQVDLAATFYYLKSLSREDKMWLVYRFDNCPVRLGQFPSEKRRNPHSDASDVSHGYSGQVAANN